MSVATCGCGAELVAGRRFCASCGRPVPIDTPEPACAGCGAALRPGLRFCPGCGAAAAGVTGSPAPPPAEPEAPQARSARFCTVCGTALRSGLGFCTVCGAPAAPVPTGTGRRSAPWWAKAVAVVLPLVAAGAAWFFTRPGDPAIGFDAIPGAGEPTAAEVLGAGAVPAQITGSFQMGQQQQVAASEIGPEGGSISAADGLVITVPAGAHSGRVEYRVTAREVAGHTFDPTIEVFSPMYTVANGGGYSDEVVTVEVPISIPEGRFAMGFVYDEAAGTLEGMPLLDLAGDHITLATRAFSSFVVLGIDGHSIGTMPPGPEVIDSGFRPGIDDWQFPNYGSVAASGGHCAGQSLSAMWYFVEQRKQHGAAALHGLYDNNGGYPTPNLWFDDRDAYRLASMAQLAYEKDPVAKAYEAAIDAIVKSRFDMLQYTSFVAAIRVTGEPQLVGIMETAANGEVVGGHAMVVYRVTATELDVADPNYPGAYRTIDYDPATGRFDPYMSGPDATDLGRAYSLIGYYGKRRFVDWSALNGLWTAFEDGTIGDGVFWPYELQMDITGDDGVFKWVTVGDTIYTSESEISLTVRLPGRSWQMEVFPDADPSHRLSAPVGYGRVFHLDPGTSMIGVMIWAGDKGSANLEYLDFRWIEVVRPLEVAISPSRQSATVGSSASLHVSVANRTGQAVTDAMAASIGAPQCSRSLGTLAAGATVEYDCESEAVASVGTSEYTVTVSGSTAAGAAISGTGSFAIEGVAPQTGGDPYELMTLTITVGAIRGERQVPLTFTIHNDSDRVIQNIMLATLVTSGDTRAFTLQPGETVTVEYEVEAPPMDFGDAWDNANGELLDGTPVHSNTVTFTVPVVPAPDF